MLLNIWGCHWCWLLLLLWFVSSPLAVTVCFGKNFQRRKNTKWQNVKLCYQSLKMKKCENKLSYFLALSFIRARILQKFWPDKPDGLLILQEFCCRLLFDREVDRYQKIVFLPNILFCCLSFFFQLFWSKSDFFKSYRQKKP